MGKIYFGKRIQNLSYYILQYSSKLTDYSFPITMQ